MPSFSDLVKQARDDKDLTQEELAKKMKMSQSAISSWENDAGYPSLPVTVKLLNILDIDLAKVNKFIKPIKPKVKVRRKKRLAK